MRHIEVLAAALLLALSAVAAEPAFRHEAPVQVDRAAPFVRLPLTPGVYARCLQAGLGDLRLIDAHGERVPFALLAPRDGELKHSERTRAATLYPLPRRPAGGAAWPMPVQVVVQGDRLEVRRLVSPPSAEAASPGWLFDLGKRPRDEPPPQALRLAWSGPAEFSAGYRIEQSDDLRQWHAAGGGQVMALASADGALTQALVPLPAGAARFVRLVWVDVATAPALTSAVSVLAEETRSGAEPPAEFDLAASAEPADPKAPPVPRGALHFDLGGVLPVVRLDLRLPPGNRVLPVRVQGRQRLGEPWREIGAAVFYRIERESDVSRAPALELNLPLRYVRFVPDERAAALAAADVRLVVQARLASLVLALQGTPPFTLQAGAADAPAGALPLQTLVPALESERPRFGLAHLGDWHEVEAVARAAEDAQRRAAMRPWLLWAVLVGGVLVLGAMVWRLARGSAR